MWNSLIPTGHSMFETIYNIIWRNINFFGLWTWETDNEIWILQVLIVEPWFAAQNTVEQFAINFYSHRTLLDGPLIKPWLNCNFILNLTVFEYVCTEAVLIEARYYPTGIFSPKCIKKCVKYFKNFLTFPKTMRLQPHLSNIVGVFSVVCLCESALFFSEMAIKLKLYI